jgi:hypothetical protein
MISFVLAGTACALTALCYAELASTMPVSGSSYSYCYAALVGVTVQDATVTLPVAVTGTATVALAPNAVVGTRETRQAWEYRRVNAGPDLIELLNKAGTEGWEAVGWSGTGSDQTLLLKRPR